MTNLLILNSQLIVPSMQYEFGILTPSELPLGNKCLLAAQVASLQKYERYYITLLPNTIQHAEVLNRTLKSYDFNVIPTEYNMDLSAVILHALDFIEDEDARIDILFSDTIIKNTSNVKKTNLMSAHPKPNHDYWYATPDDNNLTFSGYSRFQNIFTLKNYMKNRRYNYLSLFNDLKHDMSSTSEWFDFGRVATYYRSRLKNSEARHFNVLEIDNQYIKKRSKNKNKLKREWEWFCQTPEALAWFTPKVSQIFDGSYQIKSVSAPTLADLFVFGKHKYETFQIVVARCCDVLRKTLAVKFSDEEIEVAKSKKYKKDTDRVEELSNTFSAFSSYKQSLLSIFQDLVHLEREYESHYTPSYMHGDFCFSNILYDFRSETPYLIDPRGGYSDESFCGFLEYDVAKFFHSLIGYYDSIICEHYDVEVPNTSLNIYSNLKDQDRYSLHAQVINSLSLSDEQIKLVYINLILLFITMIPLHSDNEKRQIAFALNAIDLYGKFFR